MKLNINACQLLEKLKNSAQGEIVLSAFILEDTYILLIQHSQGLNSILILQTEKKVDEPVGEKRKTNFRQDTAKNFKI